MKRTTRLIALLCALVLLAALGRDAERTPPLRQTQPHAGIRNDHRGDAGSSRLRWRRENH